MDITFLLLILESVILIVLVALIYSENKKMEKQYEELSEED